MLSQPFVQLWLAFMYLLMFLCYTQGDGGESSDLKFKDDGTTLEEILVHFMFKFIHATST